MDAVNVGKNKQCQKSSVMLHPAARLHMLQDTNSLSESPAGLLVCRIQVLRQVLHYTLVCVIQEDDGIPLMGLLLA